VAERTLSCFRRTVPAAVPGIVFLSGGQSAAEATANLDAINRAAGAKPWKLSYSFGRALQQPALTRWAGLAERESEAQAILLRHAANNSAAALGQFGGAMEIGN
jgi:fructose-bisphosphate aldolase class I